MRKLLKRLAAEGRTVFVSSHLMSEMALTADHLIVIGRGRLIADMGVDEFVRARAQAASVRVRSPQAAGLRELIRPRRDRRARSSRRLVEIDGLSAEQIGERAAEERIVLHELTPQAGIARGGVHGAHPRVGRVPHGRADAERERGAGMSGA